MVHFGAFQKITVRRVRVLLVLMSLHFNTTSVGIYMALTMGQSFFFSDVTQMGTLPEGFQYLRIC